MKNSKKIKLVAMAVFIALANYMGGCSVVGLGAGMVIDNTLGDEKRLNKWECGKISDGTETTVHLSDGSAVSGEFSGLEKKTAETYKNDYAEFRKANGNDVYLPEIGDTIRIKDWDGEQGMHEFLGFDYLNKGSKRSLKKRAHALYTGISAITIEKNKEKYYSLKYLDLLEDINGNIATGKEIETLSENRSIPLRSQIALRTNGGYEHVNIENVNALEIPRKKYAKWVGLGLGLIADGFIVAVIIAINSMPGWG